MIKIKRIRARFLSLIILIIILATLLLRKAISVSNELRHDREQQIQNMLDTDLKKLLQLKKDSEHLIQKSQSDFKIELPEQRKFLNKEYLIVEYTKFFDEPKFCGAFSEEIFNSALEKCEYTNCRYTCDTNKDSIDIADALIFHQRDLETDFSAHNDNQKHWLDNTKLLPYKSTREKIMRRPNQIWVLWNDEPTLISSEFNQNSVFFNWTLSYKKNSEVYDGAYGFLTPLNDINVDHVNYIRNEIYSQHFKQRKDAILWFVSNCKSIKRINIALEMSKVFPVHVYGKCDIFKSIKRSKSEYPLLNLNLNICPQDSTCEKKLFNSYKYYFALESKNCTDYITEKLWKALRNKMIPIVLQPTRDSYTRSLIPHNSIIHLEDFNYKPKDLAIYLNSLKNDFEAYFEHLKWTSIYFKPFDQAQYLEPHRMCQLCNRLNTFTSNVYYNDIGSFFNGECTPD